MKKLLFTLALTFVAFTANAQSFIYDVNQDGAINVTDIACLANKILGVQNPGEEQTPFYLKCPDDHHPHMIDLGLPSGTKWACCNVDADKPEAYGGYYAWGETEEKSEFGYKTYQYYQDGNYVDIGNDIAGTQYDVAHVKWGGSWQMPSESQIRELVGLCSFTMTIVNGTEGAKFTGPNGGSIFLPAQSSGGSLAGGSGIVGEYWSSTPFSGSGTSGSAHMLSFREDHVTTQNGYGRISGLCVRPVCITAKPLFLSTNNLLVNLGTEAMVEISGSGSYTISLSNPILRTFLMSAPSDFPDTQLQFQSYATGSTVITVTDNASGKSQKINVTVIKTCPDGNHPHIVDLGLPSGTKWACCNVGASEPFDFGGYYAWGETKEKWNFSWDNYAHCDGSSETCHDLGADIAGTEYDVAHVKMGGSWRMPNYDQIDELFKNCSFTWISMNGNYGHKVTGPNGKWIFLPAAGCYNKDYNVMGEGIRGFYWSSTPQSHPATANELYLVSGRAGWYWNLKYAGLSVRPITK